MSFEAFEHCGIKHQQDLEKGVITLCQAHYAVQLKLMDLSSMNLKEPSTPLNALQTAQYLSLLGGLSWMAQTRVDVGVFICALQRAAKSPCVEHAVRLCKVVKWVKRRPCKLTYLKLTQPCRITVVSDSAFRKESAGGLAMRGAIIGITSVSASSPGDSGFHVLEFFARKQRRVTRSTFSAELNGLSDAYEFGKLIAMTFSEIIQPYVIAKSLTALEETGSFQCKSSVSLTHAVCMTRSRQMRFVHQPRSA
jgi:hypothetical protein